MSEPTAKPLTPPTPPPAATASKSAGFGQPPLPAPRNVTADATSKQGASAEPTREPTAGGAKGSPSGLELAGGAAKGFAAESAKHVAGTLVSPSTPIGGLLHGVQAAYHVATAANKSEAIKQEALALLKGIDQALPGTAGRAAAYAGITDLKKGATPRQAAVTAADAALKVAPFAGTVDHIQQAQAAEAKGDTKSAANQYGKAAASYGAEVVQIAAAVEGARRGPAEPAPRTPEKVGGVAAKPEPIARPGPVATEPAIPRGMSRNEMLEPATRDQYFPGSVEPVPKQPGVDWVVSPSDVQWTKTVGRTGTPQYTQTVTGGQWVQGKRLEPGSPGTLDTRVRANVADACKKFFDPVRLDSSTRSATLTDIGGDGRAKLTTTLTRPESLLVHIEIPNFSQLPPETQANLQAAAQQELNLWKSPDLKLPESPDLRYEGRLEIRVQVVEAPPAQQVRVDASVAQVRIDPSVGPGPEPQPSDLRLRDEDIPAGTADPAPRRTAPLAPESR